MHLCHFGKCPQYKYLIFGLYLRGLKDAHKALLEVLCGTYNPSSNLKGIPEKMKVTKVLNVSQSEVSCDLCR